MFKKILTPKVDDSILIKNFVEMGGNPTAPNTEELFNISKIAWDTCASSKSRTIHLVDKGIKFNDTGRLWPLEAIKKIVK